MLELAARLGGGEVPFDRGSSHIALTLSGRDFPPTPNLLGSAAPRITGTVKGMDTSPSFGLMVYASTDP